ncbi:MAG TPA: hypothetical protein VIV55_01210 [Flavobacterium sp.]
MKKNYFIIIFMIVFCYLAQSQEQEKSVQLKQINIVRTNFRNLKDGEVINKTISFQDGKISSIKTSDVIQNFFYNPKGLLDRTVKEKTGSDWKEVANYTYDQEDRLIKFSEKYQEGNEFVTKTVTISYQGARVKAITKKSISKEAIVENVEYIVENGLVARRSTRDRNEQIINKTEYAYTNGNVVRHKGLLGDTSTKFYTFDGKKSAEVLIVRNMFGENYRVIVPLISFHEKEFNFQMISEANELSYRCTAANDIIKSGKYKYNNLNYPESYSLLEEDGMIKTVKTYIYE